MASVGHIIIAGRNEGMGHVSAESNSISIDEVSDQQGS